MIRYHDNCFSRFPRVSRDDATRSADFRSGPWRRPGRLRHAASEAAIVLVGVGFFAGLAFAPAIWGFFAGL